MANSHWMRGTARRPRGSWTRRMMQGAVVAVIAASVPMAWSAGGISGPALGAGGIQVSGVSAGTAAFSQAGAITTVRTGSQNTIINYSHLSVSFGETLNFVQPNGKSRVLNRINSADPTQIDGTVQSNGFVYFVNPAGVMFGNGAVVNVAGLYAAAGNMADADFLAANNLFTSNAGVVSNSGLIQGGEVHLVGQNVVNAGQIETGGISGIVTLTAGKDVYIGQTTSPSGSGTVLVKVSSDTSTVHPSTGVTNTGNIDAGKGQLHMGAGDLYAAGIYSSGSLKGQSITLDSGQNTNVSIGKIDASNSRGAGGTVELLGQKVGVFGGTVDASGSTGGGTILVGGDEHGGGNLPVSQMAVVADGTTLRADATATGNGGKIVVYSSDTTEVGGNLSTLNGVGGHGGFIETSGLNALAVTQAPQIGEGGTWLLDPHNITISNATTTGVNGSFTATADNAVIKAADILTALGSGDVVISTGGGGQNGDVTWIAAADMTYNFNTTRTLTINAAGAITINAVINNSGANDHLNLVLNAGDDVSITDNIDTNGGAFSSSGAAFSLAAGKSITTAGGDLTLTHTGVITLNSNSTLDSGGGDITLKGSDVAIDPTATLNAGAGTVFFYTSTAGTAINIGGAGGYNISTAELDTAIQSAANIVIGEAGVQTGAITWDAAADYTYNPNATVGLRLNTSGNLTMGGDLSPQSVNDHLNLTLSGAVSVTGAIDLGAGEFFANGASFTTTGAISTTGNDINIMPTGAVSIQALVDASATGIVRLGGSTITEAGSGEVLAGSLAVRATDNVTLDVTTEVATLGAVNTGSGKGIDVEVAEGVNFNTVSAATVPTGFAAFAAVSGIQTNNGNITVSSDGNMVISNPLTAGTGNVSLSTTSNGNINGSGATSVVSGANITLNADGAIGNTTAPILAPTGNVSLTTAGANAAGNINVAFFTSGAPGTLTTSQITTLTTDGGTAQAITLGVAGNVLVNGALSIGTDTSLSITASGNIDGDGNAAHAISGPTINLSAAGIGIANAVSVNPTTGAALTTTGTGAAGNITLTTTAALSAVTFDTDNGSAQAVTVANSGALNVAANVGVEGGDTLVLHAGTSGAGNLTFTGVPTISADTIVLWAGKGDGSAAASIVDFTNKPLLADHTGAAAPSSVTVRQDGAITDSFLTTADISGGALPSAYTLQSDGGDVTVATAANVAGTNLALVASKTGQAVNINADLTGGNSLISLTATATTINPGGDVTTSGDQTFNGAFVLAQDTTLTADNITFSAAVTSQSGQFLGLTTVGTGIVWFKADVGSTAGSGNELGSLDSTGTGTTQLGNGANFTIVTKEGGAADGHVSLNNSALFGNTTISATTTTAVGSLTAGVADVTFTGTMDSKSGGDFAITVNSPGVTWFKGNVGGSVGGPLVLGGIQTDFQGGAFEKTELGNGATVSLVAGSPITFNDPVVLMADTSLSAANPGGVVTFNQTVDSDASALWNLSVAADSSIVFKGNVGSAVNGELGAVSTSGTASLSLGNGGAFSITTLEDEGAKANATGAQSYLNATTLKGDTTLTAENTTALLSLSAGEDDITLGGALLSQSAQFFGITVNTPGVTWFKGGVSGVAGQELGSITTDLQGGALEETKFGTSGSITVLTKNGGAATGAQIYNDDVVLTGNTTFHGESLAFNGTPASLDGSTFDLTLASDAMTFAGGANSVSGTGNLTIQPLLDSDAIVVGSAGAAANTLFISRTDLLTFADGFASITIGSPTGTHAITVESDSPGPTFDPVAFNDPVTIQSPGGTITVDSQNPLLTPGIYGAGNASITLHATGITLNASLVTDGNAITLTGPITLGTPTRIDIKSYGTNPQDLTINGPAGAPITIAGNIDDDGSATLLVINAGFGATLANVELQGAIGSTTPINGFAVAADQFLLHGDIRTTGDLSQAGAGTGLGLVEILSNTFALAGDLHSTITIDTDASGGVKDAGAFLATGVPIDRSGASPVSLVIDTSATGGKAGAAITLGSVGASQTLSGLSLIAGTGNVSIADVTLTGAFSSSGATFGNSGAITTGGNSVTINQTGLVTISAPIAAGAGAVGITGVGITTAAGGTIGGAAITLAGGSGNVTLGDTVTGTGLFTSGGAGFSNAGVISAHGITINQTGAVAINAGLSSAGFAVNVTGVGITSNAAGAISGTAITLAGGTSAVNLTGAVTATGALSITGTGITTNAGGTLGGTTITLTAGTGNVVLGDTVTGTALFSSSGAGFSNAGVVSAPGITINHTGAVAINAGLSSAGHAVSVTGAGITSGAGGTIAGAAITLTGGAGNVTLGGVVTGTGLLTASGVNFTNTAAVTGVGATLTMTGPVSIQAALDGGTGAVSIAGGTFNNTAAVTGNSIKLSQSGAITLAGNLNANSGAGAITLITSSGGLSQSAGVVSGSSLALSGTGAFSLPMANTISTTLAANVTGALTFTNASSIAVGTAGSPAVTGITASAVTLNITGTTTVSQNITSTTGDITISSPVTIAAGSPTVSANGNLTTGALSVVSGTPSLSAGGDLLAGAVTVTAGTPALSAMGNLTTGAITGGGNLSLRSGGSVATNTTSIISVGAVGTSPASRFGNITFLSANVVQLGGDIFAGSVSFQDNLAGTRTDVPQVATIFSDTTASPTHTLTIDANGTFTMELNQKLTVHDSSGAASPIGNLTIKTNHQEITVGDLSALGKIDLDTGDVNTHITLLNRAPAHERLPSGALDPNLDGGMDIVAGFNGNGAISMRGTIAVVGGSSTHRIQFGATNASLDIQSVPGVLNYLAGSNLQVIPVNITTPITEPKMLFGTTVLDLVAVGASGQSPSSLQGSVIPRDVQTLQPEQGQEISGALRDALRELGIYARDLRPDELIEYLIGRALYDDVPYKLDPLPTDNQVASNRLPYSPVLPTVDAYRALFFKQEVDANGNPVTENGKPKMAPQDQAILTLFGQTWQQYRTDKGDAATPEGFRGYLEANEKNDPKFPQALSDLNQLRDLLAMIKGLGLTDTEFDVSRKVLLSKVRPANIREEDFLAVVNGPSTLGNGATALK